MVHPGVWPRLALADEVWHAGDLGPVALLERFQQESKVFRAVYGNADPTETRYHLPLTQKFSSAGARVIMHHIVGRPGKYPDNVKKILRQDKPHILVCGHSHILLVAPVPEFPGVIHLNPGAAGHHGFHTRCTLLEFTLESGKITHMQAIDLGPRGRQSAPSAQE